MQPLRNIAILAHADVGKTTITGQFLYLFGQNRQHANFGSQRALSPMAFTIAEIAYDQGLYLFHLSVNHTN